MNTNYSLNNGTFTTSLNATISTATFPDMVHAENPCKDFPTSQSTPGEGQNISFVNPNDTTAQQNPLGTIGERAAMIQCQLFNFTYDADFKYSNGEQNIIFDGSVKGSDTSFTTFVAVNQSQTVCGNSTVWWDCGRRCFGLVGGGRTNFSDQCDKFDLSILQVIAYQGVMESFTNMLLGTITLPFSGTPVKDTSILSTTLMNTNELDFLNDQSSNHLNGFTNDLFNNGADLQGVLADAGINASDIAQDGNSTLKQTLSSALEEMFQNYTISLMSSKLL